MKRLLQLGLVIGGCMGGPAAASPLDPLPIHGAQRAPSAKTAAATAHSAAAEAVLFPRPAMLQPNVRFWKKVFATYSEYQSVIHFIDEPQRVYRVIDVRGEAASLGPDAARRLQARLEKQSREDVDRLLREVHLLRHAPEQMNHEQRRVYELFADRTDPDRYRNAVGRFRSQRGLRERTELALQVSGMYLPKMEAIFISEGLPVGLTRLPLVESSFNVDAYSKVGAAGLWQFIPSSARMYMRLDEAVDERRDPWTSTRAAAAHLKADYAMLGNWPLAVTAYNHGRAGLARGLREVNGESLEDLLERWSGRRFGFASRNFYAEFLAALDIDHEHHDHFGPIQRRELLTFETVNIDHYVPYAVLRRIAEVDEATFRQLNPGYRPEVLDGRLHVPPKSTIRVPVGQAQSFKAAYTSLDDNERFTQQQHYYVRYRVQRGDTLSTIARRHSVSVSALQQANNIRDPSLLRVGQTLRIPPRYGAQSYKVAATSGPHLHTVRRGQTLSAIARQYRTTVAALRELNGLDENQVLLAGVTLKIPSP
jgi:membrane-bound lytic murein transglycosylase D